MAEAVGLAFGGIALIGLFSTCLEIVDYVADAKAHQPDAALAATQVALLRTRLSQWGDRLSITSPGEEHQILRQKWPEESEIIIDSLLGIKRLFDHSAELIGKHVAAFSAGSCNGSPKERTAKMISRQPSGSGVVTSHKDYNAPLWGRGISRMLLSARWALNDRTKLDSCINQLEFFVSNLEKVCKRLTDSQEYRVELYPEMNSQGMRDTQEAPRLRGPRVEYPRALPSRQDDTALTGQLDRTQGNQHRSQGSSSNTQINMYHPQVQVGPGSSNHPQGQTASPDVFERNITTAGDDSLAPSSIGPYGVPTTYVESRPHVYRDNRTNGGLISSIGPVTEQGAEYIIRMRQQTLEARARYSRPT